MIKTELQGNSLDLRTILDMVNNLPNKGSGTGEDISAELTAQDALISEISLALDEAAVAQADAFAAIGVTYPEGSTCTCSNGTKTLTAKDTSGQALFLVPEAGTWTVTSTDPADSTKTKSQSVSITKEGQWESVKLSYATYIFNNGLVAGYTNWDKDTDQWSHGTVTVDDEISLSAGAYWDADYYANFLLKDPIDLSEANALTLNVSSISGATAATAQINVGTSIGANDIASYNFTEDNAGNVSIDVSSIENSTCYLSIYVRGSNNSGTFTTMSLSVSQIWL